MLNTKQSYSSITSVIFYTYSYNHKKINQLEFGTYYSLHSKGVISTGRNFIEILLKQ